MRAPRVALTVRLTIAAAVVIAGLGLVSAPALSATGGPTFIQQATGHARSVTRMDVPLGSTVTTADRIVVEVGVWSSARATATTVTDTSGNAYVVLSRFVAADSTEMSIWSAPVSSGGTKPTIGVTSSSQADVGVVVLEYSGLSTAAGTGVVDVSSQATGKTGAAGSVSAGPTAAAASDGELAIGFYADSGFGVSLTPGPGFTQRSNVSPASDMQLLAEDQIVNQAGTSTATAGTGAQTTWLMATLVFSPASGPPPPPTAPAAPVNAVAAAGNTTASVTWQPGSNGGSPITSFTVTAYVAGVAQTSLVVTGTPPATTVTFTGLSNGTGYTFAVTATNGVGTSLPSAASNLVTPERARRAAGPQHRPGRSLLSARS